MKRVALLALLVVAVASPAMAGQIWVGSYGPHFSSPGGEFTLQLKTSPWLDLSGYAVTTKNLMLDGGMYGSFQTFCVEGNEFIYRSTTYNATIDPFAELGGAGSSGGKDVLSVGTGWLYKQFATGDWSPTTALGFSAYVYGAGRSPAALQQAIWWLEGGEEGATVDFTNNYVKAVVKMFGTWDKAKADGAGEFGVSAVNLKLLDGRLAQTQLYYVPDGGATLLLLGGALMGLGALRRKVGR